MQKRYNLLFFVLLIALFSNAQTTGVDFNLPDCNTVNQSLYKTLDSGKVVVLIYEHQCAFCLDGALYFKGVYNSYYINNPNIRVMYLDNGGFKCDDIDSFIVKNNLISGIQIALNSDYSTPYGNGMPVIVICGPYLHKVYFSCLNLNDASDTVHMHHAIDSALMEIPLSVNNIIRNNDIRIFPNPTNKNNISINLNSNKVQNINIEITDIMGKTIYILNNINIIEGENAINLSDAHLSQGVYLISFKNTDYNVIRKLIINK